MSEDQARQRDSAAARPRRRYARALLRLFLLVALPLAGLGVGAHFYIKGGRFVETENAYVKAHVVAVSTDVDGRVEWVGVNDNQRVSAGQPLFRLDAEPFGLRVRQAEAQMQMARTEIESLRAEYEEVKVETAEARDRVRFFEKQFARQTTLKERQLGKQQDYDEAESELQVSRRRVRVVEQRARRVLASLGGDLETPIEQHPRYLEALSRRDQAAVDLARTSVLAPAAGIVSNMRLQAGEYVEEGEPVFSLIATNDLWVEANLKETDLTHVVEGQAATLVVDAYPDREWRAVVDTIAPATGAEFSLLPPQNATGNWVKVVQRLPVKLKLIEETRESGESGGSDEGGLRAGMTVAVRIDTEHRRELPAFARSWLESDRLPELVRGFLRTALAMDAEMTPADSARPTLGSIR